MRGLYAQDGRAAGAKLGATTSRSRRLCSPLVCGFAGGWMRTEGKRRAVARLCADSISTRRCLKVAGFPTVQNCSTTYVR